jgi:hypothetical protein
MLQAARAVRDGLGARLGLALRDLQRKGRDARSGARG